jgi:hypothetical protein
VFAARFKLANGTLINSKPFVLVRIAAFGCRTAAWHPAVGTAKPEMSAKVSFLVPKMKNGDEPRLTVPKSAIHIEGTESYVWTVRDGMAKRATIVRGRETEAGIEVTQGVKDGDIVIIAAAALTRKSRSDEMIAGIKARFPSRKGAACETAQAGSRSTRAQLRESTRSGWS